MALGKKLTVAGLSVMVCYIQLIKPVKIGRFESSCIRLKRSFLSLISKQKTDLLESVQDDNLMYFAEFSNVTNGNRESSDTQSDFLYTNVKRYCSIQSILLDS